MRFAFFPAAMAISSAFACTFPKRDGSSSGPALTLGPEGSDPETTSYYVNHLALNVNNLDRSLDFYTKVFGMRHMFTMTLTKHLSITYMGHSRGGKNGTGYQTTEELIRYKNNAQGMIELVYFNITREDIPGPPKQTSTLNHIGIIVPNTTETQSRLEKYGVEIYKKVGDPWPSKGPLSNPYTLGDASNLNAEDFDAIKKAMGDINMLNIFAADPDGNLLEILPLDEQGLFD